MRKGIRISLGAAVVTMGVALVGAPAANAQVRFEGSFPLPHGRITIGSGGVRFQVGGFVPRGYAVYDDPDYGYGFYDGDEWIPCGQQDGRWVILGSPVYLGNGYARPYYRDRGFERRSAYAPNFQRGGEWRGSVRSDRSFQGGQRFAPQTRQSWNDRGFRGGESRSRESRGSRNQNRRQSGRDRRGRG
ncbi:MAG: hypothetical protein ACRD16_15570 [Thermoanaerobaculia bacterium]